MLRRTELKQRLESLNPPDFDILMAAIPDATTHVKPYQEGSESVDALITWAESGSGPGLPTILLFAHNLFPDQFPKAYLTEDGTQKHSDGQKASMLDAPKLFISYAKADKKWLDQLLVHLYPLEQQQKIRQWTDRDIPVGAAWKEEIEKALQEADIAVLLVTPAFFNSGFIRDKELPELLKKRVVWVAVEASLYKFTPIADLQCANNPARPLDRLTGSVRSKVWVSICEQILAVAATLSPDRIKPKSFEPLQDPIVSRLQLLQKLITLSATNIDLLVVSIPGANSQDIPTANVLARVANLLTWAQSGTGPGLQTVVDTVQILFPQLFLPVPRMRPLKHLPYERNGFFTGREEVLQRLHEPHALNRYAALIQVISGLGGIGKTQTAIEYAYRHWDDYEAIFWCPANSDDTLNTAYRDIAIRLDLPAKDAQNHEDTNESVKTWLSTNSSYLLLLDNADNFSIVKKYLPSRPAGHVLITSRAQDFAVLNIRGPVRLHELPVNDALTFLLQRAERENTSKTERAAAADLAQELGYLPLALEQAGAYIVHHEITFEQYLVDYRRLRMGLLERYGPVTGEYPETVYTTWNKSFTAVRAKSEAAAELLTISAFFAPDAVPNALLLDGASELGELLASELTHAPDNQLRLRELLTSLTDYSLIHRNTDAQTYDIHSLVQAVIQAKMNISDRQACAERAVRVANRAFPGVEFDSWPLCERLLPHALACLQYARKEDVEIEEMASLCNEAGYYLNERGFFAEAEPLYQEALKMRRNMLPEGHPDIALSLNNLAVLYKSQGRYTEAEPLYQEALGIFRKALPKNHPNIATCLDSLAVLYDSQGRYAEAELLYLEALGIRRQALSQGHPDIALSLNNLAELYRNQGLYEKAEPLYLEALGIRRQALSQIHPNIALSLNNLAALYDSQGRYAEAELLYLEALGIGRQALSQGHPDTALSLNNLAVLYKSQGRYAEAEPLYQEALAIWRKALPEGHPDIATSLNNLAVLYKSQGLYEKAELFYLEALEMRRKALPEGHPDIAQSLYNLAGLSYSQGLYKKAEPLFEEALEMRRKALPEGHPDIASSLYSLARLYHSQGLYEKAEPLFEEALEIDRKMLGDKHPVYATDLNGLAELYQSQGLYEKAKPLYVRTLMIKEKALGQDHPNTATSLNNLAGLYKTQGYYDEAEPLIKGALATWRKALPEGHPNFASGLNNLAGLYKSQGRYDEAEPLYLEALAIWRKALPAGHPDIAQIFNDLAGLYKSQGRYDEAEPLYLEALAIWRKALPDYHPNVASCLNNLAGLYKSQGLYEKAEPLYLEAFGIQRYALPAGHPDIAQIFNDLAGLYKSQGRYDEAEPLYLEALAIWRKALPAGHPDIATSLNDLAGLYKSQGRYDKAEPLYLEALAIWRNALPAEHPDIATSLNDLAELYRSQSLYDKAELLLQQATNIYEKVHDHRGIAVSYSNLGRLYTDQSQWNKALHSYQRGLVAVQGMEDRAGVAIAFNNVGEAFLHLGKWEDALDAFQEALRIFDSLGDKDDGVHIRESIATILLQREQAQVARDFSFSETQRFFVEAGFQVNTISDSMGFCCLSATSPWKKKFKESVYVQILTGRPIKQPDVSNIYDIARQYSPQGVYAFIVVDKPLEDSAWLQIGAFRGVNFSVIPIQIGRAHV